MHKKGGYSIKRWLNLVVITLFSIVSLTRCANIGMPQGGPIDSLPPIVVSMNPATGATNFSDTKIFIEFDEYVTTKELQKELYTSPMMNNKPTIVSKGRGIEITINDDSLMDNTTYAINLGSSVVDNNEGNPYHGLRYVFSTGSEVDSMMVSGYTVDAYKRDSVSKTFIHFYDAQLIDAETETDSTLLNKKASVVARAEGNGIFIAQNLKPIPYRVYAFEDSNGNQIYDAGEEMVGFMDSLYNPTDMEGFSIWYDTVRHYFIADPQLYIRLFKDDKKERQKISSLTRPHKNKLVIGFADKEPQIHSLKFDAIDSTQYIIEHLSDAGDSIAYWINAKPDELPDSIYGEIGYMKPDSTGEYVLSHEELLFVWEEPEVSEKDEKKKKEELSEDEMTPKQLARKKKREEKREKRELKRKERAKRMLTKRGIEIIYKSEIDTLAADSLGLDSIALDSLGQPILTDSLATESETTELEDGEKRPENPFKFTVTGGKEVNPEEHIAIEFAMPLIRFDSTTMVMIRKEKIKEEVKEFAVETKVEQDSLNIRLWRIKANWIKGGNYSLTIPEGSIENVAREMNDTLKADFSVMNPDKFATLTVNLKGRGDNFYVIEVTDEAGSKVIQSRKHCQTGSYKFQYVSSQKIRVRFVEDHNNNGEWDKGSLVRREQPEEVEYYVPEVGETINAREGWEIEIEVDMSKLFEPQTMQKTIDEIERAESKRRAAAEKEKRESKKTNTDKGNQGSQSGSVINPRDALGGFGM